MKKNDQKIKCSVDTCKFNDCDNKICQLQEIKVGCGCENPNCKDDTVCNSFEESKK